MASNQLSEPLDAVLQRVEGAWGPIVQAWRASPQGNALVRHVDRRVAEGAVVYPAHVLRALELTPLEQVRVVVVGQDPYHGPGQAEGLSFSVPAGVPFPPSLRNIFKEVQRDLGYPFPSSGSLQPWARRGVLLLNTALTVEDGQPASHSQRGWESLTDALIGAVAEASRESGKVFMLWGSHAQSKRELIRERGEGGAMRLLESNHPSPLSATRPPLPFIGCGHFSLANEWLLAHEGEEGVIDWRLP